MSEVSGMKRWVLFEPCPGAAALLGDVVLQCPGAKEVCGSCSLRKPDLKVKGTFLVPKSEKADAGSEKAGQKTWNETPVCCHMAERVVILADKAPELAEKFGCVRPPETPIFPTGDTCVDRYFNA